ncbi:L-seryl-tRNA(Ser) seleniumtransferase [Evansella vedderi]|uniref:L-seryl-tRNA(Sec) selenium transferase n=1 Tax=Evansella vedderi TaxID=38282 RepID=A0ABU0A223_9BACI|nr:L-seryl-tRNA(Sec) selenium transferase [Evansella vedderi]MDQ0257527.1 L-seryl-tRNA(Ser) seleniumtransferase [Evansella vedderi]
MTQVIRMLPAVHEVQQSDMYRELVQSLPKLLLKEWVQEEISRLRESILHNEKQYNDVSREELLNEVLNGLAQKHRNYVPYRLQRLINGTGTVLHTNLGRARLSDAAIERVVETSKNYSSLEYDVAAGKRGSRHDIIQDLLAKATNSEAAMVVNNNAAAVYLILRALGKGREVIVSRGELVEIGGSFRVSTIMEESDATLVEVGTTNKTHPYDYENAINEQTKMLMKVHTSNFKTVGFTKEVTTKELKEIAKSHERPEDDFLIVYEDLGSGSLFPFKHDGIGEEPVVKEALTQGADIVSFSGDKLLGGPQAGIIAGKKELIQQLKKHPLARVLRVDKMTLAALEATLYQYVYEEAEIEKIPTIRDILQTEEQIEEKVNYFLNELKTNGMPRNLELVVATDASQVGGGTMPTVERPTVGVKVIHSQLSTTQLERSLREGPVPIITRIKDDQVFIDFRTIAIEEVPLIVESLANIGK